MDGVDEDWVFAGTRRHADYPNLSPGDYIFRVKGSNNDGVWNEESAVLKLYREQLDYFQKNPNEAAALLKVGAATKSKEIGDPHQAAAAN